MASHEAMHDRSSVHPSDADDGSSAAIVHPQGAVDTWDDQDRYIVAVLGKTLAAASVRLPLLLAIVSAIGGMAAYAVTQA
jgi:hypothetical protein